jgi:metal-responsive CopG/Arc/MetJ family transcriptional regulator
MQAAKTKVQVSLDQSTLDLLDFIVEHVPDVESRSAAIRWAARHGAEGLSREGQGAGIGLSPFQTGV